MPVLPTTADVFSRSRRAGYDPAILRNSCVLVPGAGALGQNVLQNLALSGVGEIRIVDGDVFELSNISRSPLFPHRRRDELGDGLPKASSVGEELALLHIDESARILVADAWIEELGLGAFAGVDVIAVCVDSLVARSYLARVAMLLDLPIVDGGFKGPTVNMALYPAGGRPEESPCWECGGLPLAGAFSCEAYARRAQTEGIIPAIQTGAAVLGGICAEAVIGLLHGWEHVPRRVAFDLRTRESDLSTPTPDPLCRHRRLPAPRATSFTPASTVRAVLESLGGDDIVLYPSDVYVERVACPACHRSCEVGAPSHRWQRDPRCTVCGGPWSRSTEETGDADLIDGGLDLADPRSSLTLEQLGLRPGDVVEIGGLDAPIRLAGGPDCLFTAVERPHRRAG